MSLRERLAADADGEDRHRRRLQRQQRVGQRRVGRVRAVADHHQAGQRQPGELLARAVERRAEPRLRAAEGQLVPASPSRGAVDEKRKVRTTNRSDSALSSGDVRRRELLPRRRSPRGCPFTVGDLHAARIVDQHAEEVLLRHRRLTTSTGRNRQNSTSASVAIRMTSGRGDAAHATPRTGGPVGQDRGGDRRDHQDGGDVRPGRRHEPELALLKDDRPVIEEQPKDRIEHVVSPVTWTRRTVTSQELGVGAPTPLPSVTPQLLAPGNRQNTCETPKLPIV